MCVSTFFFGDTTGLTTQTKSHVGKQQTKGNKPQNFLKKLHPLVHGETELCHCIRNTICFPEYVWSPANRIFLSHKSLNIHHQAPARMCGAAITIQKPHCYKGVCLNEDLYEFYVQSKGDSMSYIKKKF